MDSLIKADIFFFITTIVVVVITLLVIAVFVYIIRILRDAKAMSGRIREEVESTAYDFAHLRAKIKEEGLRYQHIAEFFGIGIGKGRKKSRDDKKTKNTQ